MVIVYPVGILVDDTGAALTAPVVTIASVISKTGGAVASHGAIVNGSASSTPISVEYDAEAKGEAWVTLSVAQSGYSVSGLNANPILFCAKDSSRVLTDMDASISSITAGNFTTRRRILGSNLVNVTFGPYKTISDFGRTRSSVSGVIVDVYESSLPTPTPGGGTFTATTNPSGLATVLFDQGDSLVTWTYLVTYPAGAYDSLRPSFVYAFTATFPPQ